MPLRIAGSLFLLALGLVIAVPLVEILLTSLKETGEFYTNPIGWPQAPSLHRYVDLFKKQPMVTYFANSVIVAVTTVALVLLLATMIAYGIYRSKGRAGKIMFGLFLAGLLVPSQVNMIPIYSMIQQLGFTNSRTGLIVVSASMMLPFSVFLITGFVRQLSRELFEAAAIDGAGEWRMFLRIAVPLSVPPLAAAATLLFVGIWNDLLFPLLLISERSKLTLPLAMLQFRGEYGTDYPSLITAVVVINVPMIVMFALLQKQFVAGISAGALKG
ncbi:carbohydrate ABC transporter permease [Cohnella sp. GCM10027633]|uniref:carbohydrate ABC transporter permease n=1 Tax=unclassified Cohnella TaxID=2636738 RepID=UPI0036256299